MKDSTASNVPMYRQLNKNNLMTIDEKSIMVDLRNDLLSYKIKREN